MESNFNKIWAGVVAGNIAAWCYMLKEKPTNYQTNYIDSIKTELEPAALSINKSRPIHGQATRIDGQVIFTLLHGMSTPQVCNSMLIQQFNPLYTRVLGRLDFELPVYFWNEGDVLVLEPQIFVTKAYAEVSSI